jgi:DNA sulfur modification protein DndB
MSDRNKIFPSLRCRMGDTIYYSTFLSFRDVADWIKPTVEIHKSSLLSRWIQRHLLEKHADGIADYLKTQDERFFNAIVVGIYGGEPTWAPIRVSIAPGMEEFVMNDEQREHLESSVGILTLSGEEKLFAIDGQHRVAGIKKAIKDDADKFSGDEIIALFVGHSTTEEGERSTRRLFTTLNKTAKRVSDADRVALDEDDGFAVVTRRLIDEFAMFKLGSPFKFAPTASLPTTDTEHVSTILSLYSQIRDLYSSNLTTAKVKKANFGRARPTDESLNEVYHFVCEYWKALKEHVPEVRDVLSGKRTAGEFRTQTKNHLLMRPIGQRAFAGAVGVLVERGAEVRKAVNQLSKIDLWVHKKKWHYIVWDPRQQVMLKSPLLPESMLLREIGEKARSDSRDAKLNQVLKQRSK